jgi:hypothetical protein
MLLIILGALTATLFVAIPVTLARRMSAARRVRHHASKAVEALKDLTAEQRDEALGQAKATIDQLDEKIEDLQQALYERWDQMDQTSRNRTRHVLDTLGRERTQVAQWYGAMMQSSAQAWNDVKLGFMKSFTDLNASFQQAREEFGS